MANKKKADGKKAPKKSAKLSNGTLEKAFKNASLGRLCPICKKRVEHAVYQRHFDDCEMVSIGGGKDDSDEDAEVVFCGIVPTSQTPSTVRESAEVRRRRRTSPTVKISLSPKPSTSVSPSNLEIAQPQLLQPNSDKIDEIDSMPLLEVYGLCLHYLEKFLGQFQSLSVQWSQKSTNKENIKGSQRQQRLPSFQNGENGEGNDEGNESVPFSQRMHETIEQNSAEGPRNTHYSLRIVWKILQRVLLCPEHVGFAEKAIQFWGDSLRLILKFLSLPVEPQKLFVLLLKRRWSWQLSCDTQKKYQNVVHGDQVQHFSQLCRIGVMDAGSTMDDTIQLGEALKLLKRAELLELCKSLKIDTTRKNMLTLNQRLIKMGEERTIFGGKRKQIILKRIRLIIGEFFRIEANALHLFMAFFTVYSPTSMDTALLLEPQSTEELSSRLIFTVLQLDNGNCSFPARSDHPISLIGVLDTFEELISYVEAKHFEERIIRFLGRHPPSFDEALICAKAAKEMISKKIFGKKSSKLSFYISLPSYLRNFTAPWILTRCIFTGGIEVAQKLRNYELAVEMLKFLLEHKELHHFCMNLRGRWYERLALNLEAHLKDLEQSLKYCCAGMEDPLVGEADKLILQNRLSKLSERLKRTPIQHELFANLAEPEKMEINGTTLAKGLGDGKQINHFYIPSADPNGDGRAEINKCNVEDLTLHYFLTKEGFTHGYHTEGSIWHTLFRLFFNDIIFGADVPNSWISRVQDDPLDLNFSEFYTNRQTSIDQRLKEILAAGDLSSMISHYVLEKAQSNLAQNSRILWHNFPGIDQITRFVRCCSPQLLHGLFRRLCLDFRGTRSGFPDLVVWNERTATIAVVEVKGPNDSLSTKQQLCLHFFRSHGVRAVVCHVYAKNDRALS